MKKAKIWITACVHLLFYSTFFTSSGGIENIVTDDVNIISLLKQNIPKDYKIAIRHIPKKTGGSCWVHLNVFHLEESLNALAKKFGNVSTNKDNINIFIEKMRDVRVKIDDLELMMQVFECHYTEEKLQTGDYFDYIYDLLKSEPSLNGNEKCLPPSCPTSATSFTTAVSPSKTPRMADCNTSLPDCSTYEAVKYLPEVVGKSLISLLLILMVGVVFLLYWKIKRGRRQQSPETNIELFTGTEGVPPPTDMERSEEKGLY
ncbi:kit ligand-like isoform X2 [Scleropages formosus]|uniref:Kit ligand n=1 Tax=Scleropages formosus TaxID=113540 RepID=A0A8C9TLY7_SCLFO|nr:kit ligand-like isoform X2 [Scleropages formosus]